MEIYQGIKIVNLGLLIKDIVVVSDLQIGYEESLNNQGYFIPRNQYKEIEEMFLELINLTNPKRIILNGDIKHEFGTITKTEWKQIKRLLDFLSEKAELILIKGNHDKSIMPILDKLKIKIYDYYLLEHKLGSIYGSIYFCHGDKLHNNEDFKKSKIIIIGHEHPAIGLRENGRVERFKCFLKGKYKDKTLIVLPSFNKMTEGTDILKEKLLSPFLKNIDDFEVYIAGENPLYFGQVKNIFHVLDRY